MKALHHPALMGMLEHQHGVASLRQLLAVGVTRDKIRAQVDARRWRRIHRQTYATFSGPLSRQAELWAALVACGPGAALSHESAAECDGLVDPDETAVVHVTVPVERRIVTPNGVRVHYLHRLPEARHPSRCPPRLRIEDTVLGLTDAASNAREAVAWLLRSCQRRLTTPDRLAAAMGRRQKMRWRASLENALDDARNGVHSMLEQRYVYRVERAHSLPRGERQQVGEVDHRRVWRDVRYRRFRTLVELDGRLGHEGDGRLRDMRRDNAATVEGNDTLRFGWLDVSETGCEAAQQLATVLRRNGWAGTPRRCGPHCTVRCTPPTP